VEHHRQLVDAIDVDAQGEWSSVIVRCHLNDERQGQDVTKGKLRHPDRALELGPSIECPGSRIHLGMIGDEGALNPHQSETRTPWAERFWRAACGHCLCPSPEPQDSLLDTESVHLDLAYRYFASPLRPKEVEHAMLLQYLHSINRDAGQSRQLTPVVHNMMFLGSTDHQVVVKAEPR
jgi:hypothetical protein